MNQPAEQADAALTAFLSGAPPRGDEIPEIVCPMCGAKNSGLNSECPACGESLASVALVSANGVWRDGKKLVMRQGAALPYRCVQSNEPAASLLHKKMTWHPQWVFVLIISPLIYIIVALILRKKAKVALPFSASILRQRKLISRITWAVCLGGMGLLILSFNLPGFNSALMSDVKLYLGLGGFIITVAGAVIGLSLINKVQPAKITNTHVWLAGVHPDYLASLPEWRE